MTKVQKLLETEVTRKQFIAMLGVGILGIFGLSSLMGIISKANAPSDDVVDYGMRNYGP